MNNTYPIGKNQIATIVLLFVSQIKALTITIKKYESLFMELRIHL